MRLWDLNVGQSVRAFVGHTSDVNSVAFSSDNRQIVSGSRDKTIRLWNTLAECKYTITDDAHSDWVSQVRFSPSAKQPLIVSCGWDKLVKVWNLNNCKLRYNLAGHSAPLYASTISPDGSLCAATDASIKIWDLENKSVQDEIPPPVKNKTGLPWIVSLTWSADGNTLFAGGTDGDIYVYEIARSS